MDASVSALLGALIGASAGVVGQIVAAASANRHERRRLAMESGFREWERVHETALKTQHGASIFPPVLFVHFNHELISAIDSRKGLTVEKYASILARSDAIRDMIRADNERAKQKHT